MTATAFTGQRMAALHRANTVRLERASDHRRVKAMARADGLLWVAETILQPAPHMQNAEVRDVLQWPRRQGQFLADQMLKRLQIAQRHETTLGELTERQRIALYDVLRETR